MPAIRIPPEVQHELRQDRKVVAIRRLRTAWDLDMRDAEAAIDAYEARDFSRLAQLRALGREHPLPAHLELPQETVDFLRAGDRFHARQSLYRIWGLGNFAAEDVLNAYEKESGPSLDATTSQHHRDGIRAPQPRLPLRKLFPWWKPVAMLLSVVWALVTSLVPTRSLIVLAHADGYMPAKFRVTKVVYQNDKRRGRLFWGFEGSIDGQAERYYAMDLLDAPALGADGLRKRFPQGALIDVWYNPAVAPEMLQERTLRTLSYAPDLRPAEIAQIVWWLTRCLLPFLLVLALARYDNVLTAREETARLR